MLPPLQSAAAGTQPHFRPLVVIHCHHLWTDRSGVNQPLWTRRPFDPPCNIFSLANISFNIITYGDFCAPGICGTSVAFIFGVEREVKVLPVMFISPATESGKNMLIDLLGKFLKDEEGQSVVEYSLLLTLIAAATILVLTAMGHSITRMFGSQEITVENYTTWAVENGRKKE